MAETIYGTYMGRPEPLTVSKRQGEWALVKHMYGYTLYHAPADVEPKSIPDKAIDPTLRQGRTWLGYRPGLAVLKDVASAFPTFDRADTDQLFSFLASRG